MSDLDHARSMLVMAQKDLNALKGMRDTQTFADEIFGFHAQQTVEKSLKAWLAALEVEYPLTHDISKLLTELENQGCQVEPFWDFVEYNIFAVQFRYMAFDITDEPLDRLAILLNVQALFDHVRNVIDRKKNTGQVNSLA